MIELGILRNAKGYVLAVVDESTGEYKPVSSDVMQVIRCKDCKHRPKNAGDEGNGFDIEFPDEICPCQCDDPWYNWIPGDEWYCANGERREE